MREHVSISTKLMYIPVPTYLALLQDKIHKAVDDPAKCSGLISQFIMAVFGTRDPWIKDV